MRKLTVVFLALALCLTSMPGVMADEETRDNAKDAFEFLTAIGVIDNYSVNADDFLNTAARRDDIVYWTMRAAGLDASVIDYVYAVFNDVPFTDVRCNYINLAYYMGIVSGREDFLFYPEDTISSNEAVKIIVSALGAGRLAQEMGGYPTGYWTAAANIGLKIKNISSHEAITNADAAILLKNMLFTTAIIDDGSKIIKDSITVLEKSQGIKTVSGVVTSAAGMQLAPGSVVTKNNEIAVAGMKFISDKPVKDLLGMYAEIYYKEDDAGNVLVYADVSKNTVTVIKSDDFISYKNGAVEYVETVVNFETKTRDRKTLFAENADVIYNGRPCPAYTDELFDISGQSGEIICISHNGGSHADVVIINAISNYVVGSADVTYKKIYSKLPQAVLDLSDVEDVEIFDAYGNERDFESIFAGDVASVMKSADGTYCKIVLCSNRENRKVIENSHDGKIMLDNKEVRVLDRIVKEKAKNELLLGRLIDIYYDYEGRICDFVYSQYEDGIKYGYLLGVGGEVSGLVSDVRIKIMKLTGEFAEYKIAEKLNLDGYYVKNLDFYNKMIKTDEGSGNKYTEPQMIKYSVDSESGEIKYVDTEELTDKEGDESLHITHYPSAYYVRDIGSLEGKNVFDKGYFLEVPSPGTDVPPYMLKNAEDWDYSWNDRLGTLDDMSGIFEVIDPDEAGWSSILVRRPLWYPRNGQPSSEEGVSTAKGNMGIFDDFVYSLDDYGEPVIKINFYTLKGVKQSMALRYDYLIKKPVTDENGNVTYKNLERGDIFGYDDRDGYINGLSIRFNISRTDNGRFYRTGDTSLSGHVIGVAEGASPKGFSLLCNVKEGDLPDFAGNVSAYDVFDLDKKFVRVAANGFTVPVIYDKEKDEIKVGTIYDIVPCSDDDVCPSIIVANMSLGSIASMFVINNYK